MGAAEDAGKAKWMSATEDQETPSWRDFMASLKFLEAEGYIEIFYNDKGEQMVRIAPGAEKARLWVQTKLLNYKNAYLPSERPSQE